MVDHLLSNYFKGHVIVCVNMYNTVYGLDFVGAHNNIPINKNTVLHIHSNPYLRLYPIVVYLHDTLQAFQSEITIYKKKEDVCDPRSDSDSDTTNRRCLCFLHYIRTLHLQYASPRRSDYIFRVCATVPTGSPQNKLNCAQFASLALSYIHNTPLRWSLHGLQLQRQLEHMHQTVLESYLYKYISRTIT